VFALYLDEIKKDRRSYVEACMHLLSELIIVNGVYELADMIAQVSRI
jgi:hypothetical protein